MHPAASRFAFVPFPKVGFYNIRYWSPSEDGAVNRCGNVIHETGSDANDNM